MKTRPDTLDQYIIDEQPRAYAELNFKDQVVLDVGANIGAFAIFARDNGASKIICFEPEEENFALLQENCQGEVFNLFNKALLNTTEKKKRLYKNSGKNKGIHSFYISRSRTDSREVLVENFYDILELYKPTVVKIDTEGSEYHMFDYSRPIEHVSQICIELHLTTKAWRKEESLKVIDYVHNQGFKMIRKPKIGLKNWTTILTATR